MPVSYCEISDLKWFWKLDWVEGSWLTQKKWQLLLFQDRKELEEPTDIKEAHGRESNVGFEVDTRH